MDESPRTKLILAARTGRLTEEQYEQYLKLLEEDPDFREQVEWQDFLEDNLPVTRDADLYAAAENFVYTERQPFFRKYSIAVAAGIALLIVAGLAFYFRASTTDPTLVASRTIELYNGDDKHAGQLGYAEGDMPAGERNLSWWKAPHQQSRISYRFCSDTLHIYFRETADTVAFNAEYKLTYFTQKRQYYLESKEHKNILLENCSPEPKPLLP